MDGWMATDGALCRGVRKREPVTADGLSVARVRLVWPLFCILRRLACLVALANNYPPTPTTKQTLSWCKLKKKKKEAFDSKGFLFGNERG